MFLQITPYLSADFQNNVEITATNFESKDPWFIAMCLCDRRTPEDLQKWVLSMNRLPYEAAEAKTMDSIHRFFGQKENDEDIDILDTSCRVRLICPITLTRLITPVRGRQCLHLQCFDLTSFLEVTRATKAFGNRWKCVECNAIVRPRDLVVDTYIEKLLQETSPDAEAAVFDAEGKWEEVKSALTGLVLSPEADDELEATEPENVDLVDVLSSDDEDEPLPAAKSKTKAKTGVSPQTATLAPPPVQPVDIDSDKSSPMVGGGSPESVYAQHSNTDVLASALEVAENLPLELPTKPERAGSSPSVQPLLEAAYEESAPEKMTLPDPAVIPQAPQAVAPAPVRPPPQPVLEQPAPPAQPNAAPTHQSFWTGSGSNMTSWPNYGHPSNSSWIPQQPQGGYKRMQSSRQQAQVPNQPMPGRPQSMVPKAPVGMEYQPSVMQSHHFGPPTVYAGNMNSWSQPPPEAPRHYGEPKRMGGANDPKLIAVDFRGNNSPPQMMSGYHNAGRPAMPSGQRQPAGGLSVSGSGYPSGGFTGGYNTNVQNHGGMPGNHSGFPTAANDPSHQLRSESGDGAFGAGRPLSGDNPSQPGAAWPWLPYR